MHCRPGIVIKVSVVDSIQPYPAMTLRTLPLGRRMTTYSSAKDKEINILQHLQYPAEKKEFFSFLETKSDCIKNIIAYHLHLDPCAIEISPKDKWLNGSYNVCIPAVIGSNQRVLSRVPLPYRVGEALSALETRTRRSGARLERSHGWRKTARTSLSQSCTGLACQLASQ
ncbi:hypothetical protein BJY01DRAFT_214908 [Aspergillus pseudoustus]|uniref:Uncharacterized protein n=1 Tax=Aspergillus pseudoustus TaxID=1810923 RepID=A0ABR4JWS5_9EURO